MSHEPPPAPAEKPALGKAPPAGRKFPCAACGARLDFDPSSRALQCPYCGHTQKIEPSNQGVVERDLEEYLARQGTESTVAGRPCEVKCVTCGAVVLLEDRVAAGRCPYCATFLENQPEEAKAMVLPEGVLPFAVDHRKATAAFNAWLAGLWFAPNALRKLADLGKLNGTYVPFWTFDSMTYTHYVGARGDDYTETEHYTETESYTDSDGTTRTREVPKTRTVVKTLWTPVSGEVQHFFDDVLVCASTSLPEHYRSVVTPKELKDLVDFRPEYLSGFTAERYTVGPKDGFDQAKVYMDAEIRQLCIRDIGGDHQRLDSVSTQHVGVTFKHVLLPVWLSSYRYNEKTYRVLVNGQTGEVLGDRPYSWVKITALVLAILAAILLVVVLVRYLGGSGRRGQVRAPAVGQVADLPAELHGNPATWPAGPSPHRPGRGSAVSGSSARLLPARQLPA